MDNNKVVTKSKLSIGEILLRIIFGFLLPFVVINGIILFLAIQVPKVTLIDKDSSEYDNSKIKFTVDCILPITSISTYFEDTEISYTKNGDLYIIDVNENGTYKIYVTALNKAVAQVLAPIEIKDVIAPAIDINNAVITGNMLIFSIYDNESQVNFESIYGITESGENIKPLYIDMSSGTVQFQLEPGQKLTVHVEDMEGNPTETTFVSND